MTADVLERPAETAQNGDAQRGHADFAWIDTLPDRVRAPRSGPNRHTRWMDEAVAQLQERPGQWAQLLRYPKANSATSRIYHLRKRYPQVEFTARRIGETDESCVYARYPG